MTNAPPTSSSLPLTLIPDGNREVVTKERAIEIVNQWTTTLQSIIAANDNTTTPLVHKINLSDKSYTIDAAKHIASFLTSSSTFNPPLAQHIQVAHLNDTIAGRMEDEGLQVLKTLSDIFIHSHDLIEVDLSDNALGSKGVSQCMSVLGENRKLQRLSLCNNGLSKYSMNEIADLLTAEHEQSHEGGIDNSTSPFCIAQNLTKIHFFNNMSGNEGCEAFERIMGRCSSKLTNIRFSSTRAEREGSAYITRALKNLSTRLNNVTHLDLCDNSFPECYDDLASALIHCVNLEYLNLKDCILSNDGVVAVCNALMGANPPLKCIHLSGNEIDANGALVVAKLVRKFKATIEILDLDDNELKSIGVRRIVKKLNAPKLATLLLTQNECGSVGANSLIECLDSGRMPSLESITLDCNNFSDEIVDRLMEVFGDKLQDMEDNYGEEEEEEEEDDDDDDEEEEEVGKEEVAEDVTDVDELAAAFSKTGI